MIGPRATRSFSCQTDGCREKANFWITKEERNKHVCMHCRNEMLSVYDWAILKWDWK